MLLDNTEEGTELLWTSPHLRCGAVQEEQYNAEPPRPNDNEESLLTVSLSIRPISMSIKRFYILAVNLQSVPYGQRIKPRVRSTAATRRGIHDSGRFLEDRAYPTLSERI
jgi:hypothetical protein